MIFVERPPHPALAEWLHCLWLFECPAADSSESAAGDDGVQRIVPDGHPELIFHYGDPYSEPGQGRQPAIVLAGQIVAPLLLQPGGHAGVIGVRFRPGAARRLFGVSMGECTGRRLDASGLWGAAASALLAQLHDTPDAGARLDRVEAFIGERLRESRWRTHAAVAHCVRRLASAGVARLSIDRLAAEVQCSGRQLERLFLADVGLPPRLLASILRFRRLFDVLEAAPSSLPAGHWADAAVAAGYFDQAHMARDFRRFAGQTPRQFQRRLDGLGRAMIHGGLA